MPVRARPRLAAIALLLLLFAWLGATGGPGNAFDVTAIRALGECRLAHPAVTVAMIAITDIGGAPISLLAAICGTLALWFAKKPRAATLLVVACLAERGAVEAIKRLYDRPRPAFDTHPVAIHSPSFPSAHAANSMTALVLFALFVVPTGWRSAALATAILLSGLIGFSRVYLGVHWPSDVIAGWAVGLASALIALRLAGRPSIAAEQQHQIVGRHRPALDQN